MVEVALDATYAADPDPTGTGVYSQRLIAALTALPPFMEDPQHRLALCFRPGPYFRYARKQAWPPGCSLSPFWEPWLRPPRAQLFHGLNQRLPRRRYPATVVTIHDLFPLTSPDFSTPEFQRRFSAILQQAVARADRIIAVSEATRQQLLLHTDAPSEHIRVVHHGVDSVEPAEPTELKTFREQFLGLRPEERVFLNVGTLQVRKNVASIVLALKQLPEGHLVLAGGDGYGAEAVHALIEREGVGHRIRHLGHVSRPMLRLLYSTATALVFPSLEEGFGLPILEAMAYGLPVITSNCSSMPEVAGDAALYVDPRNVSEIAEAMRRVAEDSTLTSALSKRGTERAQLFSWRRCAEQTWGVYQELFKAKL